MSISLFPDDSISLPTQLQQDASFVFSEKSGCNNGKWGDLRLCTAVITGRKKNISIYRINRTFHFWMHYIRHFDFLQLLQNLPLYYYLEQLMKRNIFIKNQQASIQLNFSIFLPFSRQTRENYWENISSVLQSFNKGHLASHSKTLHLKKV